MALVSLSLLNLPAYLALLALSDAQRQLLHFLGEVCLGLVLGLLELYLDITQLLSGLNLGLSDGGLKLYLFGFQSTCQLYLFVLHFFDEFRLALH